MIRFKQVALSLVFVWICVASAALADDDAWGDLSGRFVYDGTPPKTTTHAIKINRDALGATIPDESLVVSLTDHGLANVLIYLLPKKGAKLRVHPSYKKSADAKVVLSMKRGRFEPHLLLLRTTQTLVKRNDDPIGHNPHIGFQKNANW